MSVTMDVEDEPIPGLDADGRPDPGYAHRLGLVPARGGRRAAAFALDALVWVVLAVPGVIGLALLGGAIAAAGGDPAAVDAAALTVPLVLVAVSQGLLLVFGLVQLILHGRRGRTLGKSAFGIRSVQVATFGPAGFWRIVLRVLVLWGAQVVVPFAGPAVLFASSGWDPESRGRSWLDRIGRCFAIDIRHGLNPLDSRALRHARRTAEADFRESEPPLPSLASDRAPEEGLFVPSGRSSSGVVAAATAGAWTPPPLVPAETPSFQRGTTSPPAASERAALQQAEPQQAPPRPAGPAFVLVFDDGTRIGASEFGLIGRAPAAAAGEAVRQFVPLADESMRISKTHAAFGVDATGFWILDRASRNGTVVEYPDGSSRVLAPGIRQVLPRGTRVAIGGRSFTLDHFAEAVR